MIVVTQLLLGCASTQIDKFRFNQCFTNPHCTCLPCVIEGMLWTVESTSHKWGLTWLRPSLGPSSRWIWLLPPDSLIYKSKRIILGTLYGHNWWKMMETYRKRFGLGMSWSCPRLRTWDFWHTARGFEAKINPPWKAGGKHEAWEGKVSSELVIQDIKVAKVSVALSGLHTTITNPYRMNFGHLQKTCFGTPGVSMNPKMFSLGSDLPLRL